MYYSNRKHAYKVVREIKAGDRLVLVNNYGAEFIETRERLAAHGYRPVHQRPANFTRN